MDRSFAFFGGVRVCRDVDSRSAAMKLALLIALALAPALGVKFQAHVDTSRGLASGI